MPPLPHRTSPHPLASRQAHGPELPPARPEEQKQHYLGVTLPRFCHGMAFSGAFCNGKIGTLPAKSIDGCRFITGRPVFHTIYFYIFIHFPCGLSTFWPTHSGSLPGVKSPQCNPYITNTNIYIRSSLVMYLQWHCDRDIRSFIANNLYYVHSRRLDQVRDMMCVNDDT
jgi:hypothetical protein